MTELDRADSMAVDFIKHFDAHIRRGDRYLFVCHPDFIFEDEDFQELVIQHIRLRGYEVERKFIELDGLHLKVKKPPHELESEV